MNENTIRVYRPDFVANAWLNNGLNEAFSRVGGTAMPVLHFYGADSLQVPAELPLQDEHELRRLLAAAWDSFMQTEAVGKSARPERRLAVKALKATFQSDSIAGSDQGRSGLLRIALDLAPSASFKRITSSLYAIAPHIQGGRVAEVEPAARVLLPARHVVGRDALVHAQAAIGTLRQSIDDQDAHDPTAWVAPHTISSRIETLS